MKSWRLYLLALMTLVAAGGVFWAMRMPVPSAPSTQPDQLAGIGGEFALEGTTGRRVALSDFRGRYVMLNFGFTHCPDVCPMTLSRMRSVLRDLGDSADRIQPVFVTFDPARDDLSRLREYLAFFDKRFIGLRGTEEETRQVTALYKVIYSREESTAKAGYGFTHTDFIYLVDPAGKVVKMFGQDVPVDEMVKQSRAALSGQEQQK